LAFSSIFDFDFSTQLLKKRNAESLQEKTAMALWALAGDDINEKREMANGIGVQTLIEFANSMSQNLHLIGSEGLGCLAQVKGNTQPPQFHTTAEELFTFAA
jgi:hypothetical protein